MTGRGASLRPDALRRRQGQRHRAGRSQVRDPRHDRGTVLRLELGTQRSPRHDADLASKCDDRKDCVLATKAWYEQDRQGVIDSVHQSLKRLQTDYIDIVQVHGRMYTQAEYEHVVNGGPLDGLRVMREAGKIRFIGITTEEPWTVIPFLQHSEFDVFQIAYNFIYQAAARHFLIDAAKANAGVVTMRTIAMQTLSKTSCRLPTSRGCRA